MDDMNFAATDDGGLVDGLEEIFAVIGLEGDIHGLGEVLEGGVQADALGVDVEGHVAEAAGFSGCDGAAFGGDGDAEVDLPCPGVCGQGGELRGGGEFGGGWRERFALGGFLGGHWGPSEGAGMGVIRQAGGYLNRFRWCFGVVGGKENRSADDAERRR